MFGGAPTSYRAADRVATRPDDSSGVPRAAGDRALPPHGALAAASAVRAMTVGVAATIRWFTHHPKALIALIVASATLAATLLWPDAVATAIFIVSSAAAVTAVSVVVMLLCSRLPYLGYPLLLGALALALGYGWYRLTPAVSGPRPQLAEIAPDDTGIDFRVAIAPDVFPLFAMSSGRYVMDGDEPVLVTREGARVWQPSDPTVRARLTLSEIHRHLAPPPR
ncbi:MAG: hypothetical protein NZ518_09300 [Dehalococcoidia bacterium]|nr:hypothetical protein [Dehalococcoidia bacterium]